MEISKILAQPFVWLYKNIGNIITWIMFLVVLFFIGKFIHWWGFVKPDHDKFMISSSNISLYLEKDCKLGCEYDPYVTFVNNNDREVTITTSVEDYETHYYHQIDMFVLKPNEKIKKYIGLTIYKTLFTIEAIIMTKQGTAEKIRLWDH